MKKLIAVILIICMLSVPVYAADEKYVYDTNTYMETVDAGDGISAYLRLPGYLGVLKDVTITTTQGTTESDVYVVYADEDSWDGDCYYSALNMRFTVSGDERYFFNGTNDTVAWKCMYNDIFQPVEGGFVILAGDRALINYTKGPGLYLGIGVIPYSREDTGIVSYAQASESDKKDSISYMFAGYNFILVLDDGMIDYFMKNGTLEKSSSCEWPGLEELIESKRQKESSKLTNFRQKYIYSYGQFSDIPAYSQAWYNSYVKKVYEIGFMMGNADGTFNSAGNITLAECLAIASRMHSIYNGGSGTFTQGADIWYQVYADYCAANGIIKANDFSDCGRYATRGEMAYIFSSAVDADALEVTNKDAYFDDVNAATAYDDEILSLARAGIVQGDAAGFRPSDNITRAEAAAIVARIADTSLRVK